jgi:hypothetical protein
MPILLSIETAPDGAWNSVNDPTTRLVAIARNCGNS